MSPLDFKTLNTPNAFASSPTLSAVQSGRRVFRDPFWRETLRLPSLLFGTPRGRNPSKTPRGQTPSETPRRGAGEPPRGQGGGWEGRGGAGGGIIEARDPRRRRGRRWGLEPKGGLGGSGEGSWRGGNPKGEWRARSRRRRLGTKPAWQKNPMKVFLKTRVEVCRTGSYKNSLLDKKFDELGADLARSPPITAIFGSHIG